MPQISVARALADLKLTDKKITQKTTSTAFVVMVKGERQVPNGFTSRESYIAYVKEEYQALRALVLHYQNLKRAIILSNAGVTTPDSARLVTVGKEQMTIAEAIERKTSINYLSNLLLQLNSQFTNINYAIERDNVSLQTKVDSLLTATLGGADKVKVATPEQIEAITSTYRKENQAEMLDPIGIVKVISELRDYVDTFNSEVDFTLSEKNATTLIEIP